MRKKPRGLLDDSNLWWLKPSGPGNFPFATTPELPPSLDPQSVDLGLYNVRSNVPLYSGEVLTLKTHNPQTHPLPDVRLLELQWILNRVAAIRGAAEPDELDGNEDTDDDGGDCDILEP